ncbi:MAG TPA: hypothetical protein VHW01_25940, partial [Polyangiaceae bacterium]|nr:hypothetical protein [Polyangiaceae bacterium]
MSAFLRPSLLVGAAIGIATCWACSDADHLMPPSGEKGDAGQAGASTASGDAGAESSAAGGPTASAGADSGPGSAGSAGEDSPGGA